MRSRDLGIGVKSQSCLVIAGSLRNWPQSSLRGDCFKGRDTEFVCQGARASGMESNSES